MKYNILKILSFIVVSVNIFSCSEPIDIKIDEADKRIVLNGLVGTDTSIYVNVTKSLSVLETEKQVEFIKDAEIKIFENNELKETLQYDTNGYYVGNLIPKINNTYKISVNSPTLPAVEAETIIPIPVAVESFNGEPDFFVKTQTWYDSDTGEPFDTTIYSLQNVNVNVKFTDPENQKNYYLIAFSAEIPVYNYYPPTYEPVFEGIKLQYLDFYSEDFYWTNFYSSKTLKGYVFSDDIFNGNTKTINANVWFGNDFMEKTSTPEYIYVNLFSINKEFLDFVISYSNYIDNIGNPFAEPVNVKSNIANGFGFFSGYSVSKDSLFIDYSDLE